MTEHTLRSYDRKLAKLTETILGMGRKVDSILALTLEAVKKPSAAQSDQARATDKEVNAMERQIEQQVTELLALQNPMAIDLRYITSASKIAASLERMGDLAKNTVRQCAALDGTQDRDLLAQLEGMTHAARRMLLDALSAYTELDAPKATQVWHEDDAVDDACDAVYLSLLQHMRECPDALEQDMHLLFASKNIERMADYAAKIAKIVHYVTSGQPATKAMLKAQASAMLAAQATPATA